MQISPTNVVGDQPDRPPITGIMYGYRKPDQPLISRSSAVSVGHFRAGSRGGWLPRANRARALGVGVEAVEPQAILGQQPEFGVGRFDEALGELVVEVGIDGFERLYRR